MCFFFLIFLPSCGKGGHTSTGVEEVGIPLVRVASPAQSQAIL